MGDSTTNQFLNCSFLGQIVCLTHVKKNLQNKLGKKTTFQNNAPSMIPLEKAQTLLKADNIMLRDTHIADGVRRIKENRWIIKIKCMFKRFIVNLRITPKCVHLSLSNITGKNQKNQL